MPSSQEISTPIKRNVCASDCEIYSRVTGYHRPIQNWNAGKQEEAKNRKNYAIPTTITGLPTMTPVTEEEKSEVKELIAG